MEEMAREPLKQLTLHENGNLIIPSVERWGNNGNPTVPMTTELGDILQKLREEFPQVAEVEGGASKKQGSGIADPNTPNPDPNTYQVRRDGQWEAVREQG